MALSEGVHDEIASHIGRPLELQDSCPCFPGDAQCPHITCRRRRLERNGAWGFNKFVCQGKGVRLLDAEHLDAR